MTTILQILVSPRPGSYSRLIAGEVVERLRRRHGGTVVERDLAADPPPHPDLQFYEAILSGAPADDPRFGLSEQLIAELEAAEWVVIGTPMNNFVVPSTLKAWVDYIVRIRRTFSSTSSGKVGLLCDRPVIVVTSHGGYRGDAPPGQPDFLTPYLRTIFETIGIADVSFVALEGLTRGPESLDQALSGARRWIEERLPLTPPLSAGARSSAA